MIAVDSTVNVYANLNALKSAAQTLFGSAFVDCNQTQNGLAWTVYLTDHVANEQLLWDNLVNNQDPVEISVSKFIFTADGLDTVIVNVSAPKPGAAPVSLNLGGSLPTTIPVTLTNGVGAITVKSNMAGAIGISVAVGTNRNVDTITITGVGFLAIPDGLAIIAGQVITFRGIAMPYPFQDLLQLSINGKVVGNTKLGTTLNGISVMAVLNAFAVINNAVGATAGPTISIGTNSPNFNNIAPAFVLPGLAAGKISQLPLAQTDVIQPNTDVFLRVSVAAVATGAYNFGAHNIGIYG